MTWTWVRPTTPELLSGRPLLDLGTGDGQTLRTLTSRAGGLRVGLDLHEAALRSARSAGVPLVLARAGLLPFPAETFGTVLAGDLFHHLDTAGLETVLAEARRVLRPAGTLVAWWWELEGASAPDAPAHPRPYEEAALAALAVGFTPVQPLALEAAAAGPPTVGLAAWR